MHYRLALLGFGNVGKELAKLLLSKRNELEEQHNITYSVVGIATAKHGVAIDPDGIDLDRALKIPDLTKLSVRQMPLDAFEFLRQCDADVLFENTPVNYDTGQPAVDHLNTALELGMHAITANKGPVVHAYKQLKDLAKKNGVNFYFESTVMDGAPIFSLFREALPGANLLSFRGILNSTTNMILTLMENGESFEQAVTYCQSIGIAETDPSGDIDGWDAAVKVAALATVLMGIPLKPQQVTRKGIRELTAQDIAQAVKSGKRWKLVCSARLEGGAIQAKVGPEQVAPGSPLFTVDGTTSIVQFETDVLGALSVIEADPGPHTTAYGLFADFLNAIKKNEAA
jgi:homoserine dehydrogenase